MSVHPQEYATFDIYFASVVSMQHHPGAGTKEHKALSIEECRDVALEMLRVRAETLGYKGV